MAAKHHIVGSSLGGRRSRLGGANDSRITYNEGNVFGRSRDTTKNTLWQGRGEFAQFEGVVSFVASQALNPFSWATSHSTG
jgi:hypothetical protein